MPRHFGRVTTVLLVVGASAAACSDPPTAPASSRTGRALDISAAVTPSSCGAVLGPATFTRATGAPVAERVAFAADQPGDWYRLVVTGGDAAGVTMRLALNGQSLLTAGDRLGARLELPVALATDNALELRLTGRPGTSIQLSIVDVRPVGSVRIVPDIVQGTAYVLQGATRDFGAEVRDAQGRPIATRCVTWRTADAAVATVDVDGLVHAVAAGTTQLVAAAGGVEDTVSVTVLEPAGATRMRSTPGPCMGRNFACFASQVTTTPVTGGRTLITVRMNNRQGSPSEPLYASVIFQIHLLDVTGAVPTPTSGFSISLDSAVTIVGSTPMASLGTSSRTLGSKTYQGWEIALQRGISGCDTPGAAPWPGGAISDWRTCGWGVAVTFSFLAEGTNWDASDDFNSPDSLGFFLYVRMRDSENGNGAGCANRPGPRDNPSFPNCHGYMYYPPQY